MEYNQRIMLVLSFVEAFLTCFILMSIVSLSEGSEDGVVILTRGAEIPPTDYVTVVEGGTLIMHCEVPTYMLQEVWWGKASESGDVYLTEKERTLTNDSRVSVSRSANFARDNIYYRTYNIRISPVAVTDATYYFCLARWKLSTYNNALPEALGELTVSVSGFENGNPNCWSTGHFTNRTLVWCETEHAYPGVNITWTVEETGQVVSVTRAEMNMDASGREWAWSLYQVSQELQNQVLVCTVKSPAFPGRNQTCSVSLPVKNVSTTVNPDATYAQREFTRESSETTPATTSGATTTTLQRHDNTKVSSDFSGSSPTLPNDYSPTTRPLSSSAARAITESSPDVVNVSTAVAIPSFTLLLVVLLLCILKRRRRQPGANGRGKNSGTTTEGSRSNCEAGRPCGVIEAPVTRTPHHSSGRTTAAGGDAFDSPYEKVELDHPIARSVTSAEAPDKDGLGQNTCVIYQTVHPADDSDSDTSSCESDSLHQERVNSYNDKIVAGGDSDKFEASPAGSDESDGRMVDNPIYQSYDDEYPSH